MSLKTRSEIYGQEAADLLRIAAMYPGLNIQQFLGFHPGKEKIVKNLLSHLEKQGRIFQDDCGRYFPSGSSPKVNKGLIQSVWVLLDFIDQVEYHAPADFPVQLVFFAHGELYEVIYAAQGQEALICHALENDKSGSRRILMVDEPPQISQIDCLGIVGFCTVASSGRVQYFKRGGI